MIVSRPKRKALSALTVFILVSLGLGGYNMRMIVAGSHWWFNYLMTFIFLPAGIVLLLRLVFNYKLVRLGEGKITQAFPARRSKQTRKFNDMISWDETIIQTVSGVYRQVRINFPDLVISLSHQENSEYDRIIAVLKNKAAKKKI